MVTISSVTELRDAIRGRKVKVHVALPEGMRDDYPIMVEISHQTAEQIFNAALARECTVDVRTPEYSRYALFRVRG